MAVDTMEYIHILDKFLDLSLSFFRKNGIVDQYSALGEPSKNGCLRGVVVLLWIWYEVC